VHPGPRPQEALDCLLELQQTTPKEAAVHLLLGRAVRARPRGGGGEAPAACSIANRVRVAMFYGRAGRLTAQNGGFRRGQYRKLGKVKEAMAHYTGALDLDPGKADQVRARVPPPAPLPMVC
jgi:hypothetical protein